MAAILEPPSGRALSRPRPPFAVHEGGRSPRMVAIYRRRRACACVVALILLAGLGSVARVALVAVAPTPPGSGPAVTLAAGTDTATVTVSTGDSFWSIARQLRPTGDVRPLVDHLADVHGPGSLQPGDRLTVDADLVASG